MMSEWLLLIIILWSAFVTVGAFLGIAEYVYQCSLRRKKELEEAKK